MVSEKANIVREAENLAILPFQSEEAVKTIRILLVDDNNSVREILKTYLEPQTDFEIVGVADNGSNAEMQVAALKPDIVLMDLEMSGIDGIEATKNIIAQFPATKIIILSSHDDEEYISKALESGAKGYLLKTTPAQELFQGIRFIYKGYLHLSPGLFEKLESNTSAITKSEPALPITKDTELLATEVEVITLEQPVSNDWSFVTKEMLDSLPQVWTRGLLYLIFSIVAIALPWGMLSEVHETGKARGRLEPQGKVIKLDAPVGGTIAHIFVKEGDIVTAGQPLLELESELVSSELQQLKTQQSSQQNRLAQLELLKNQILLTLRTQQQQNQTQQLEKQVQVEQARRELDFRKDTYSLQKQEKQTQIDQARQNIVYSQNQIDLAIIRLQTAEKEAERYRQALNEGISTQIKVVEQEELVRERQRIKQQAQADVTQAKLRLKEQQNSYQTTIANTKAEIKQAQLRLEESQRSYDTLINSGKLALLRIEEQQKDLDSQITSLIAEISQSESKIKSKDFQLQQRIIKASQSGTIFDLAIDKPGAVVQAGETITELAPTDSTLIAIAQIPTSESGSLKEGMDVKLKFDAYPFQDYGIVEGKLIRKSPTSQITETSQGQVATFDLEIELAKTCLVVENNCEALKPGDTVTAEVIVRKRKAIDFLLDPFKKLQKGGLEL